MDEEHQWLNDSHPLATAPPRRPWVFAAAGLLFCVAAVVLVLSGREPTMPIDDTPGPTAPPTASQTSGSETVPGDNNADVTVLILDGLAIVDVDLVNDARFRVTLPERLAQDLELISSSEPIELTGPTATILVDFSSCDQEAQTLNAQGASVSVTKDGLVEICRTDEAIRSIVKTDSKLDADELDSFDIRPIRVAGAYREALFDLWPDLADCSNCAAWGPMVFPDQGVVVNKTGANEITAVRLDTLEPVWSSRVDQAELFLHGGPNGVYIDALEGAFQRLDPIDGNVVWSLDRDRDERDLVMTSISGATGLVRTSFGIEGDTRAPVIREVDLDTGELLWTALGRDATSWQWSDLVMIDGRIVVMDVPSTTTVLAPSGGAALLAFDVSTGQRVWETPLDSPTEGFAFGLLISLDFETSKALLVQTIEGDVLRIDPTNGAPAWRTSRPGSTFSGTALGPDQRLAIELTGPAGRVLLDPSTGEVAGAGPEEPDFTCPVTVPPDPGFVPAAPYPPIPPELNHRWFGDADLFTSLAIDGHEPRKSVWWSTNYVGGEFDDDTVGLRTSYVRLDADADPIVFDPPGTGGFTPESHWFLLNGNEPGGPDDKGCWRATATFEDATLSYVYEVG